MSVTKSDGISEQVRRVRISSSRCIPQENSSLLTVLFPAGAIQINTSQLDLSIAAPLFDLLPESGGIGWLRQTCSRPDNCALGRRRDMSIFRLGRSCLRGKLSFALPSGACYPAGTIRILRHRRLGRRCLRGKLSFALPSGACYPAGTI